MVHFMATYLHRDIKQFDLSVSRGFLEHEIYNHLTIFKDADHAHDTQTRRSVSCVIDDKNGLGGS